MRGSPCLLPAPQYACIGCGRAYWHPTLEPLCRRCELQLGELAIEPDWTVAAPFQYAGPLARPLAGLKYGGDLAVARPLARRWTRRWSALDIRRDTLLVPVPAPWHRRLSRGVPHVHLLAWWLKVEGATGDLRCQHTLRQRRGPRQVGLSRTARLENMRGRFRCDLSDAALRGADVVVVDDVVSTGATLQACMDAIRPARPARLRGLALLQRVA